ncbi:MAG: right-handed parallel beta-helix repeat-containing protein, partial [FCB group bacterium]|nr:right-handed parallel beta-helix repeat-containing protein [FCB group bacterium]
SADLGSVYNDGNVHYIEVLFRVLRNGWNKDRIGSHIVRNNTIFNCEQAGICGTMGAAFSTIENNHIYNIWTKRQFGGDEIGGIKLHAPVDVLIRNNRIHNSARGLWLDWMTQGTRVSGNLLYDNDRVDVYFEVNHGPFVADNNVLLSPNALITRSQGGAFIHNLFGGMVITRPDHNRFTPYFLAHSTDVAGLSIILGGDDRYFNNIFIGKNDDKHGLTGYDNTRLPNHMEGNVYYRGALPSIHDKHSLICSEHDPDIVLQDDGKHVILQFTCEPHLVNKAVRSVTGDMLGNARIPKAPFVNPDGCSLIIDKDYFGNERTPDGNRAGPFQDVRSARISFLLW